MTSMILNVASRRLPHSFAVAVDRLRWNLIHKHIEKIEKRRKMFYINMWNCKNVKL